MHKPSSHYGFEFAEQYPSGDGEAFWWHDPITSTSFELSDNIESFPAGSAINTALIGVETNTDQHRTPTMSPPAMLARPRSSDPTVPKASRTSKPAASRHKFQCDICFKTFDRLSRLERCQNRHTSSKPHFCVGRCGVSDWYVKYRLELLADLSPPAPSAMALLNISTGISITTPSARGGKSIMPNLTFTEIQ